MSIDKSLVEQARARIAKTNGKVVNLVFIISYDLKDGTPDEYAQIIKALGELGYSRNSSAGEDTLPKNFYAGEKAITYYPDGEPSLKEAIKEESLDFKKKVENVMDKEAKGKLSRLFMSASLKETTAFWVK